MWKPIGDIIPVGKRLSRYRVEEQQVDIFIEPKPSKLGIYFTTLFEAERELIINSKKEVPLTHQPLNLLNKFEVKEKIKFLKNLSHQILSQEYPNPVQTEFLIRLKRNPTDPLTQALISCCKKQICFCELFFSVGCPEFCDADIASGTEVFLKASPIFSAKRPIKLLLSALRQCLTVAEIKSIEDRLRGMDSQEFPEFHL